MMSLGFRFMEVSRFIRAIWGDRVCFFSFGDVRLIIVILTVVYI